MTTLRQYVPPLELEFTSEFESLPELRSEFLAAVPSESRFEADYSELLGEMQFESAEVQTAATTMISAYQIERTVLPTVERIVSLIRREPGSS